MSWHADTGYYAQSRNGVNANLPWTEDELRYIRDSSLMPKELAKLMGRSVQAIQQQKSRLVRRVVSTEWKPTKWWQVTAPDGSIWCETSSESEAREKLREGDTLRRMYEKTEQAWQVEE